MRSRYEARLGSGGTGFLRLVMGSSLKSLSYEMPVRLSTVLCGWNSLWIIHADLENCRFARRSGFLRVIYRVFTRSLLHSYRSARKSSITHQRSTQELNSRMRAESLISFQYQPRVARTRRAPLEETILQSNKLNGDLIRISLAVAILCLLVVGARMRGQEKADLTVRVKVVNVPATVRDKHGKIVNNLTKDDFVLEEDGRPQTLHYFSQESSLPLTLGLLVDTSMSQRRVLGQERTASSSFIDQMLRPEKDKAFLIHFDHEVELDQDLTSSQRESCGLLLDSLQSPQFTQTSGGNSQGQGGLSGPPWRPPRWQQPRRRNIAV